jgi:hypothetical protein
MAPAVVPTAMMLTVFGTRAVAVMMTAFDHYRLGACNRRRRNRDRAESRKNITKLLHLAFSSNKRGIKPPDKKNVPPNLKENSEQLFSKWLMGAGTRLREARIARIIVRQHVITGGALP